MLRESTINCIALLCALTGIIALALFDFAFSPREISVKEINEKIIGEKVSLKGKIDWVVEKEKFVLFGLNDGNKIKAIVFYPTKEERELIKKNNFLTITGKVQLYKNELEIIVEKVEK